MLVYQIQSYRHRQQHFGRDDFSYGMFGENLTVCLPDRAGQKPPAGPANT